MEEHEKLLREVVEVYRQPHPGEVVETYSRPLPVRKKARPAVRQVKRTKKGLWIFLVCVAGVLLLSTGAYLVNRYAPVFTKSDEQASSGTIQESEPGGISIPVAPAGQGGTFTVVREHGEVLSAQEIYQRVNPSVVTVMARVGDSMSVGTGVIFTQDGYILTNHHVLEDGEECAVALDTGYTCEAFYVAGDALNDLAILKIEETDLPAAEFGESDFLSVGERVYAIGNPLGVELRGTLTDGIVSAINRDVWVNDRNMTLIQTNAALNSGNSGGPLINEYGQVVGINVIKMTSRYSNVEGLGFSIPSASIRRIANDLLTFGELKPEPLLGVSVLTEATELEGDLWGLEAVELVEGGAAARAGVQTGDFILTADGEELRTSQDLLRIRQRFYLGDRMTMTLWRNGEILEVVLELTDAVEEETVAPWYVE